MAETIIASYFEDGGVPSVGLTPEIRIWEVSGTTQNLIIGTTQGSGDPGPAGGGATGGTVGANGVMLELYDNSGDDTAGADGGSKDGFYRYTFHTDNGYDPEKSYVFRIDGGSTLSDGSRYQVGDLSIVDDGDAFAGAAGAAASESSSGSGSGGGSAHNGATAFTLEKR